MTAQFRPRWRPVAQEVGGYGSFFGGPPPPESLRGGYDAASGSGALTFWGFGAQQFGEKLSTDSLATTTVAAAPERGGVVPKMVRNSWFLGAAHDR